MSSFETVNTSQLRTGDVVHTHGMRLLVDREVESYLDGHVPVKTVYRTSAKVTNATELDDPFIVHHMMAETYDHASRRWTRSADLNDARWTIQGNDFATWTREVRS